MQENGSEAERITGCRFAIYPMTDRFAEIILEALAQVDTTHVRTKTDDVGTTILGCPQHVFDVAKAVFIHVAHTGIHVVFNGTFSVGDLGNSMGEIDMATEDERANEAKTLEMDIDVAAQFALYPLGMTNYKDVIAAQLAKAKARGTLTKGVQGAGRLDGSVHDVFATLEEMFQEAQRSEAEHVVLTAVVSANSPSKKDMDR